MSDKDSPQQRTMRAFRLRAPARGQNLFFVTVGWEDGATTEVCPPVTVDGDVLCWELVAPPGAVVIAGMSVKPGDTASGRFQIT